VIVIVGEPDAPTILSGLHAVVCLRARLELRPPLATEVDALGPLPGLDAAEEQGRLDEDDAPLPRDPGVLEHDVVDDRDVQDREDGDEAGDDRPEEELVAPGVVHPLREVPLGLGLHAEEGAAHVDHLPGEEEREPGETDEGRRARAEYQVTLRRVVSVAASTEVAVAKAPHHQGEGREAERGCPDAVDEDVDDDLPGEDTLFLCAAS